MVSTRRPTTSMMMWTYDNPAPNAQRELEHVFE